MCQNYSLLPSQGTRVSNALRISSWGGEGKAQERWLICFLLAKVGSERLGGETPQIWNNVAPKGQAL